VINPRYNEIVTELRVSESLEKVASFDDEELAANAMLRQAELCDGLFVHVQKLASELPVSKDLPCKEAAVAQMLSFALSIRETHEATGEKLAASPEEITDSLAKLATAVFVDQVLGDQMGKMAGAERDATRAVQLLGREYAVHLMRGFLA